MLSSISLLLTGKTTVYQITVRCIISSKTSALTAHILDWITSMKAVKSFFSSISKFSSVYDEFFQVTVLQLTGLQSIT